MRSVSTVVSMFHPVTGEAISPIGFRADGTPIFPMMGGSEDDGGGTDDGSDAGDDGDGDGSGDDANANGDGDGDNSDDGDDDSDGSDDGDQPWDEKRARADHKKLRNENKNLRDRAKKVEADAAKWREHQKSQLSNEDRLKGDLTEKDQALAAHVRENALLKVRLETGLSEKQVKRLQGDDYESLLEDANEFIADNPGAVGKEPAVRKTPPAKNLKGGTDPGGDDDSEMDPAKLASRVKRGY